MMNPNLALLQPYPFAKLAALQRGLTPPADKPAINLCMGEPAHPAPPFIAEALAANLDGLGAYPTTKGLPELRAAIGHWLERRFGLAAGAIDPDRQVLPVNGTREALFSFAQATVDLGAAHKPVVVMPNPFYQIYEGAALLAGAEPYFVNTTAATGHLPDFSAVPEAVWRRCQLLYLCSPANPSGAVMDIGRLRQALTLAERHGFLVAADECYSELYDDADGQPPPGLLQAAQQMGNTGFARCVVFHSLSKRSNVPGLRSGFVAGDAEVLARYLQYRTYHGCAMPLPSQHASIRAWQDERHVIANRRLYREKFSAVTTLLSDAIAIDKPAAGFYLWLRTPIDDCEFSRRLFASQNLSVLPGSFLSRAVNGQNPGQGHVRIALVAGLDECVKAAHRLKQFLHSL